MARNQFGSKIGLVAATLGSAVGLGNVWRFPAEAQANGGAAFLMLYIVCVLLLGVPVMLAEMSLGRGGRSDAVGVFRKLSPGTSWWIVGVVAVLAPFLITGYYMVVEGWTLEYLFRSISGELYNSGSFDVSMQQYLFTYLNPWMFTMIVLLANMVVMLKGVQKGIERLSNVMMPLLFVVLVAMCCMTLSLDGAADGLKWFLAPDFSKITVSTVIDALGQTFFSLSLGMGILVTYSSYYPASTKLTPTAVIVALMSLVVALLMGFIIFPAVTTFGLADHALYGPTLVFQTLPEVFNCLPGTQIWSALFFLLLFVAALTSTISLLEVQIAFLCDRFGMKRRNAVLLITALLALLSTLCSFSPAGLGFELFGMSLFDFLDFLATNILLPLVAIAICAYMGWFAPNGLLKRQLTNDGTLKSRLSGAVLFIVRYVAPVLIALIFIFSLI